MPTLQYDRSDSQVLKGIGILLIVLHNFFHTFPEFPPECEFEYIPDNVGRFVDTLGRGNLRTIVLSLFSFLGHYGVSVFVFVSGYGLAKRYGQSPDAGWRILLHRATQLWKWIVPMALLLLLDRYSGHTHITYQYLENQKIWTDLLAMLTFTANFLVDRFVIAGPWWYFGMAFQLYVIYVLFLRRAGDRAVWIASAVAWALLLVLQGLGCNDLVFTLRYNFVGWLPVFCIGILAARHPLRLPWGWVVLGCVLFVLSLFNPYLWVFSSTLVLFPFTAVLPLFKRGILYKITLGLGGLSAALFITHAFVRQQILIYAKPLPAEWSGLLYLALCLAVAWIYRQVLIALYKRLHW